MYIIDGKEYQTLFDIKKNTSISKTKIKELEAQEKIDNAYISLQKLCDTKSQEAKNYIAGKKVTDEQLVRYNEKYQMAKEYKENKKYKEILELEADLHNLTIDDLVDSIVAKRNEYKESLMKFNAKIEALRTKVSEFIKAGDIDKANEIIEKAKNLDINATNDDIKRLFE